MDRELRFLDNLEGRWMMTGTMGEVDLRQDVTSRWVLGGSFMQMCFDSVTPQGNPTANYAAVYHIGYNRDDRLYVLHLLDTTEVPTECVMGMGRREGQSIAFRFAYPDAVFTNKFTWVPEQDRWRFLQTSESEGKTETFAMKEMTRIAE